MKNLDRLAELAKSLPANYQEAASNLVERMGEVIEGIGDKPIEWRPEALKLVQGTSDRSKLPKGANIGSLVLGEDIVEQPFEAIPLRTWTARQYWNPDPEQATMLCSSPDSSVGFQYGECKLCPYSKFDQENNKSQCNKTITGLFLAADLSRVFTYTFAKTNYANGTDFQQLMKKAGVAPHKRVYALASQTSTKSKNVELLKVEPAKENRTSAEILAFVEELAKVSGEDRKAALERFYEYVELKKKNSGANALAAPEHVVELLPSADETVVLDSSPVVDAEVVTSKEKPAKGTKYAL